MIPASAYQPVILRKRAAGARPKDLVTVRAGSPMEHCYSTYIMASRSRCLYIGVTGDLVNRIGQHKGKLPCDKGFSALYRTSQLVYYETTADVNAAIAREKQLKGWRRAKKVALIERVNPAWRDLARAWPAIDSYPSAPMDAMRSRSRPR